MKRRERLFYTLPRLCPIARFAETHIQWGLGGSPIELSCHVVCTPQQQMFSRSERIERHPKCDCT